MPGRAREGKEYRLGKLCSKSERLNTRMNARLIPFRQSNQGPLIEAGRPACERLRLENQFSKQPKVRNVRRARSLARSLAKRRGRRKRARDERTSAASRRAGRTAEATIFCTFCCRALSSRSPSSYSSRPSVCLLRNLSNARKNPILAAG